ncbi:MAG: nucleotidyltransferase family protein [Actinomycetota bacterium]
MSGPVVGVVIAAGSSRRLGEPKQLLPYRGATLLDASLDVARRFAFDQRIVTIGGAADEVRSTVDMKGFIVVRSRQHAEGCSSSIHGALEAMAPDAAGLVLLLGDQPTVAQSAIAAVVTAGRAGADIAVCSYGDGIGHPFWFGRETFAALADLHGDKAVWKVIESGRFDVHEVPVDGPIPPDVDTWDDYRSLVSTVP